MPRSTEKAPGHLLASRAGLAVLSGFNKNKFRAWLARFELVLVVTGTMSSVDQRSRVKEREEEKRRGGKRQAEGGEAVGVPFTANRAGWLAGWAGLAGWLGAGWPQLLGNRAGWVGWAGRNYLPIGLAGWAGGCALGAFNWHFGHPNGSALGAFLDCKRPKR